MPKMSSSVTVIGTALIAGERERDGCVKDTNGRLSDISGGQTTCTVRTSRVRTVDRAAVATINPRNFRGKFLS